MKLDFLIYNGKVGADILLSSLTCSSNSLSHIGVIIFHSNIYIKFSAHTQTSFFLSP